MTEVKSPEPTWLFRNAEDEPISLSAARKQVEKIVGRGGVTWSMVIDLIFEEDQVSRSSSFNAVRLTSEALQVWRNSSADKHDWEELGFEPYEEEQEVKANFRGLIGKKLLVVYDDMEHGGEYVKNRVVVRVKRKDDKIYDVYFG